MNQLQAFIHKKSFVTQSELKEANEDYRGATIREYDSENLSNDLTLEERLCAQINDNFQMAFNENEIRRKVFMEERRNMCLQQFLNAINNEIMNNPYVEWELLEQLFRTNTEKVINSFKECFDGENPLLFRDVENEVSNEFN